MVAGLKEQNISNLGIGKLSAFPTYIPRDLDEFVKRCEELEGA